MVTNFFIGFFGRQMQHFPTEDGCFIKIMLRCRLKTTSDKILELVCEILNVSAKYPKIQGQPFLSFDLYPYRFSLHIQ